MAETTSPLRERVIKALDAVIAAKAKCDAARVRWENYPNSGNKTDDRLYDAYQRAEIKVCKAATELLKAVDCDGYV